LGNNITARFAAGVAVPKTISFEYDSEQLSSLCRINGIRRLALFGSVLRDDFRADSDVDVLVEFLPGRTPGLHFFTIQNELQKLFGRRVDLNTPEDLSPGFRDRVRASAEALYVAT
jgi:predicted nucleotidyltransferase